MAVGSERHQRRDFSERRFSEAFKYVSRGWMPVQSPALKDIRRKVIATGYAENRDELIDDLRNDFSLFTYCLRELGRRVPAEERRQNPVVLLKTRSNRELQELLSPKESEISSHDFVGMKEVQLMRLKHQLVSAATVELIAEKQGIDRDIAFMAAMMRQLGMALVAWNYPSTCQKALSSIAEGPADDPLDFEEETLLRAAAMFERALG